MKRKKRKPQDGCTMKLLKLPELTITQYEAMAAKKKMSVKALMELIIIENGKEKS